MDGQSKIDLPPAIMQNKIPDAWDQVPSRREVENIPGYREYAKHFPEKKTQLPTIALIGRDCMQAQYQRQISSIKSPDQLISITPLGYTLMGARKTPVTIPGQEKNVRVDKIQETKSNLCALHPNRNSGYPHYTLECHQFSNLNPEEKWAAVNKS